MAKGSKKREKAERSLDEARTRLADLQARQEKVRQKADEEIERARREAEEKVARAAQRVERQAARVSLAEQRVRELSGARTPADAADRLEENVAEGSTQEPESPIVTPDEVASSDR
jgi:F0F1-type ATP synthase membrane subunit b/b'